MTVLVCCRCSMAAGEAPGAQGDPQDEIQPVHELRGDAKYFLLAAARQELHRGSNSRCCNRTNRAGQRPGGRWCSPSLQLLSPSLLTNLLSGERQCELDLFLGGSCNPTTWRKDTAIPLCEEWGISYYNPQVEPPDAPGWHCLSALCLTE